MTVTQGGALHSWVAGGGQAVICKASTDVTRAVLLINGTNLIRQDACLLRRCWDILVTCDVIAWLLDTCDAVSSQARGTGAAGEEPVLGGAGHARVTWTGMTQGPRCAGLHGCITAVPSPALVTDAPMSLFSDPALSVVTHGSDTRVIHHLTALT